MHQRPILRPRRIRRALQRGAKTPQGLVAFAALERSTPKHEPRRLILRVETHGLAGPQPRLRLVARQVARQAQQPLHLVLLLVVTESPFQFEGRLRVSVIRKERLRVGQPPQRRLRDRRSGAQVHRDRGFRIVRNLLEREVELADIDARGNLRRRQGPRRARAMASRHREKRQERERKNAKQRSAGRTRAQGFHCHRSTLSLWHCGRLPLSRVAFPHGMTLFSG